jgi:hypothetical protein
MDGTDGTIGLFLAVFRLFRGTGYSRNSLEEKMLGILYSGTKKEANPRDSVPHHSAEEENARNFVPCKKNMSKLSEFLSEPFHGRENNSEFRSV